MLTPTKSTTNTTGIHIFVMVGSCKSAHHWLMAASNNKQITDKCGISECINILHHTKLEGGWIFMINKLVENHNNAYHTSIKMTPNEASKMVDWYNIYGAYLSSKYGQPKFKVGQTVRIAKYKSTFDKGYLPNYTAEFF